MLYIFVELGWDLTCLKMTQLDSSLELTQLDSTRHDLSHRYSTLLDPALKSTIVEKTCIYLLLSTMTKAMVIMRYAKFLPEEK